MGLVGHIVGGNMDLSNKGVLEEEAGNNCRVCIREDNIPTL